MLQSPGVLQNKNEWENFEIIGGGFRTGIID